MRSLLLAVAVLGALATPAFGAGEPPCTITGTPGPDRLKGTDGPDVICGMAGDDILRGLGSDDILLGGTGHDVLAGDEGADVLDGNAGIDTVTYNRRTKPVYASIGDGDDDGAPGEADEIRASIERLEGGTGADTLVGTYRRERLDGGAGADEIRGTTTFTPTFYGSAPDEMVGGAGNDTMRSGTASDYVNAGDGDDRLIVAPTDLGDYFDGGSGVDTADFSQRTSPVTITVGTTVRSTVEIVIGGQGGDTLTGNGDANTLVGGPGDDTLNGAGGTDHLEGGADRDILDGGRANIGEADSLDCGEGPDRYAPDPADALTDCEVALGSEPKFTATAIATGTSHACGLRADGTVGCWGSNFYGQLGDGTATHRRTPVTVSGLTDATAITAGGTHTCALRSGGTVACWGLNTSGQLGNGETTPGSPVTPVSVPVPVAGLTNVVAITAGAAHTCALRASGAVLCWGWNGYGELGHGTTTSSSTPIEVTGLSAVSKLDAGYASTCAVRTDQLVRCWGAVTALTRTRLTPAAVAGLPAAASVATSFTSGCAILSDRSVTCWRGTAAPASVTGWTNIASLDGAGLNTASWCAVHTAGTVSCLTPTGGTPTPVAVSGVTDATGVAVGYQFAGALRADTTVACWGTNTMGQLGDGSTIDRTTPVPVIVLG
ncbi:MAG: hypothetical protein ACEQSX_12465 [Baekduiaceae bacterium]